MTVDTVYEEKLRQGGDWVMSEADEFFDGGGTLRRSLRRLVELLRTEGIPYALLGGLALGEHGYPRMTQDIDLLLSPAGLDRFRQRLVGAGYRPAFEGACKTFRDSETGVRIEVLRHLRRLRPVVRPWICRRVVRQLHISRRRGKGD